MDIIRRLVARSTSPCSVSRLIRSSVLDFTRQANIRPKLVSSLLHTSFIEVIRATDRMNTFDREKQSLSFASVHSFVDVHSDPPRVRIDKSIDAQPSSVRFQCQVCSLPVGEVIWLKNGQDIVDEQFSRVQTSSLDAETNDCLISTLTIEVTPRQRVGVLRRTSNSTGFRPQFLGSIRMSRREHSRSPFGSHRSSDEDE